LTFSFTVHAPTALYTLSLHDALPIFLGDIIGHKCGARNFDHGADQVAELGLLFLCDFLSDTVDDVDLELQFLREADERDHDLGLDRKSTRLNSSHVAISYAVFCLKNK